MNKKIVILLSSLFLVGCGRNDDDIDDVYQEDLSKTEQKSSPTGKPAKNNHHDFSKNDSQEQTREHPKHTKWKKETKPTDSSRRERDLKRKQDQELKQKRQHKLPIWNAVKVQKLTDYMRQWGEEMDQNYQKAYPDGETINYYGYYYPQDVSKNNFAFKDQPIDVALSKDGESFEAYNIVAIFSDIESHSPRGAHLYVFTLKNNKPVVLVTSQNQGNEENLIYFDETENLALKTKFEEIVSENDRDTDRPQVKVEKSDRYFFSSDEKEQINQEFYDWATERAEIGNMASSTLFFNHGSGGSGDWFGQTPDGKILVQDEDNPGKESFPIEAIGGMLFFTAVDGTVGHDAKISESFIAEGYSRNLDPDYPASKYLLGDNGVVYEYKKDDGNLLGTGEGFTECNDSGVIGEIPTSEHFIISEDQAAQSKLKELIAQATR